MTVVRLVNLVLLAQKMWDKLDTLHMAKSLSIGNMLRRSLHAFGDLTSFGVVKRLPEVGHSPTDALRRDFMTIGGDLRRVIERNEPYEPKA